MDVIKNIDEVFAMLSDVEQSKFQYNVEYSKSVYGQICYKKGYENRDKEIIRCKDCKYYKSYYEKFSPYFNVDEDIIEEEKHTGDCHYNGEIETNCPICGERIGVCNRVKETDFCSRGKRKDEK